MLSVSNIGITFLLYFYFERAKSPATASYGLSSINVRKSTTSYKMRNIIYIFFCFYFIKQSPKQRNVIFYFTKNKGTKDRMYNRVYIYSYQRLTFLCKSNIPTYPCNITIMEWLRAPWVRPSPPAPPRGAVTVKNTRPQVAPAQPIL